MTKIHWDYGGYSGVPVCRPSHECYELTDCLDAVTCLRCIKWLATVHISDGTTDDLMDERRLTLCQTWSPTVSKDILDITCNYCLQDNRALELYANT